MSETRDTVVVITTSHFKEVYNQLGGMNLPPNVKFYISPALKGHSAQVEMGECKPVIHLTCSDAPNPRHPTSGGGLYSYNPENGHLHKWFGGKVHGIVKGVDAYYMVDDESCGVIVLNQELHPVGEFKLSPGSRPHGIGYDKERELIFVNLSDHDSTAVYDAQTYKKLDELQYSDKRWNLGESHHHVNDVLAYRDSLYVSMFSFTGNWKLGIFDGGILEVDIDSLKITGYLVRDLWMPHTPTVIDGKLWYCDSMRGKVHCGTEEAPMEFSGFVRGIAHDSRFYYVGQSLHRHPDRLRHVSNNIPLSTGIYMFDKESRMTKFFSIPQLTDINTIFIKD